MAGASPTDGSEVLRTNWKRKDRDVVVSTLRLKGGVYESFKAALRERGFVHYVDGLQLLLKAYVDSHLRLNARRTPKGRRGGGTTRDPETIKVERRIYVAFKCRVQGEGMVVSDAIQALIASYTRGEIDMQLVATRR